MNSWMRTSRNVFKVTALAPIACEGKEISVAVTIFNFNYSNFDWSSRQSEELIGQMKNHVRCLNPECTAEYSLETLRVRCVSDEYFRGHFL
jgi:hypothetical protein